MVFICPLLNADTAYLAIAVVQNELLHIPWGTPELEFPTVALWQHTAYVGTSTLLPNMAGASVSL